MNYEETLQLNTLNQLKTNNDDLIQNLDNYNDKIKSLLKQNHDLNLCDIKEQIKQGNPFAIALLRKSPTKQNISETTFFEYTGLKKLPASGKKAIRFDGSKSADFKIGSWFGTQKYIKDSGGAQDNQLLEAAEFAKKGNKLGYKIIVCVDGSYGKKRIKNLLTENANCVIVTADKLKDAIANGRFK